MFFRERYQGAVSSYAPVRCVVEVRVYFDEKTKDLPLWKHVPCMSTTVT